MDNKLKIRKFLIRFCLITAFEAILTLFIFLNLPTDPKNAWLFGISRNRSIISFGLLALIIGSTWLAVNFSRNTKWSDKAILFLIGFLENKNYCLISYSIIILTTIFGGWLLAQWQFTETDQQISAYLIRLTPLAAFIFVISTQLLILFWILFINGKHNRLLFLLILFGGITLFWWLFIFEFLIVNKLYPAYFIAERYGTSIQRWMPLILFKTAIFVQLPFLVGDRINLKLKTKNLIIPVLIILGYFYYNTALFHAQEINLDMSHSDQSVYVEFTRKVYESNFKYSGNRNQTPGFAFFQAIFCNGKLSDSGLFSCGKRVNVVFSLVFLIVIFLISNKYMPIEYSFSFTLINAFSIFIFKSGYFTAEIIFYFVGFLGFVLMSLMFFKPSAWLGLVTGFILGLAHLLKASVLPSLMLFFVIFLIKNIYEYFKHHHNLDQASNHQKTLRMNLLSVFWVLVAFLGIIFPYLQESKKVYGQYFYNVNSTYLIWFDSWDQAKNAGVIINDEGNLSNISPDQLPSWGKYLREHSFSQIVWRLIKGINHQMLLVRYQYGVFNYIIIISLILLCASIINWKRGMKLIREFYANILFTFFYCFGYIILFAWYTPIAGGPRFIQSLFLPFTFSSLLAVQALINGNFFYLFRYNIRQEQVLDAINMIIIAILMADAYIVITKILPTGYFGS